MGLELRLLIGVTSINSNRKCGAILSINQYSLVVCLFFVAVLFFQRPARDMPRRAAPFFPPLCAWHLYFTLDWTPSMNTMIGDEFYWNADVCRGYL